MTLVSDIVQVNANGAFFNDVQLRAYRDRARRELLARTYIFTTAEKGQEVGSVDLLETMVSAFLPGQTPNRMMVIATFGHGKSHFAVSAATYFGSAIGDPALEGVFEGLQHAISDPIRLEKFKSFKQNRKPLLVVLLSGDEAGDLPSKFSRALELALKDDEATASLRPPFWFTEAEKFLQSIDESRIDEVNRALEPFEIDLAILQDKVGRREDDAFDMAREVSRALYGFYPDFQGATNLRELVEWTVDTVCGIDGPMGGLLILFDEFSTFVQTYGAGRTGRNASPLQDLLNGVANRRERAAFVAFGQVDPKEIARGFGGAQLDSLAKELDRIESSRTLKSVLEEVLDSFLKQEDAMWEAMSPRDPLRLGIEQANDAAWRIFAKRYEGELKWNQTRFRHQVSYGCFPLHPMTTALFSTVEYRATSNPRSVLRFVLNAAEERMPQPAVVNGNPNWTLPYELVDYFADMLDPNSWEQYEEVRRALGGDITLAEERTLQSMLLISAASVPVRELGYDAVVASFAGLKPTEASSILQDLHNQRGFISYDSYAKTYAFWPVGGSAIQLEKLIDKEVRSIISVSDQMLSVAMGRIQSLGDLKPIEVPVQLGHPEDWQAEQHVITANASENPSTLRKLATALQLDVEKATGRRSAVVWVIATNDEEVAWAGSKLSQIVDEALGNAEVPLITMQPTVTTSPLLEAIKRIYVIERLQPNKIPAGAEQHLPEFRTRAARELRRSFGMLPESSQPIVPQAFRADVQPSVGTSPQYILADVYRRAFRQGPRDFYPTHKVSSTPLTTAVLAVAQGLSQDNLADQTAMFGTNKVAADLVDKVLRPKWGIVSAGRGVQPPNQNSPIYDGWRALSEHFQAGSTDQSLRKILNQLLNPPFGYDPRTLTLLLAAWYGWHRHDLALKVDGRQERLEELLAANGNSRRRVTLGSFLAELGTGTISRQNEDEPEKSVKRILDTISIDGARVDLDTAQSWLTELSQFYARPRATEATRQGVPAASTRLRKAIDLAKDYDAKAALMLARVTNWQNTKLEHLVHTVANVKTLPVTDIVRPIQPSVEIIEAQALDALKQQTERLCDGFERLSDLALYEKNRQNIAAIQRLVREFPELADRARIALERLEESNRKGEEQNRKKALDEAARAEMRGMSVSEETGAVTLQSYFDRLGALVPGTEACSSEIKQKQKQIEHQLSMLESAIDNLSRSLKDATSRQMVSRIRERGLRLEGQVRGSQFESALSSVTKQSEDLGSLFGELEDATKLPMRTPIEAQHAEDILTAILKNPTRANPQFLAQIYAAIKRVKDVVIANEQEAIAWLDSLEKEFEHGVDPWKLDRQAAAPHPFLPVPRHAALSELRRKIEHEKNRDRRRQVIELFEGIGDDEERQALARDLWQRAFEESPQISVVD